MPTYAWAANSHAIPQLYLSLDDEFKARLDSNGCSLFRLLKMPIYVTHMLTPLVDTLLSHYDCKQNVFIFGSHRLRITLEDVLFITGLPISSKPVIMSSNTYGTAAFQRLFGPGSNGNSLTLLQLESHATNKGLDADKRMIAVLLYVISCFIAPTCHVNTAYVEFVENLGEVESYAWGAALLAFLYRGINKWKDEKSSDGKKYLFLDGNVWLLLCFFFVRIPKLMSAVGVELEMIVEKVRIAYKGFNYNYPEYVVNILNNLSDDDIRWLPYDSSWLPPRLQDQYRFRALVAPLFCNNYVVHHRPQLVPKQFGLTEGSLAGFGRYDYEIKIKQNKGPVEPDYLTFYKKEIELWKEGKQLLDFISSKHCADVAEPSSSPPRKKSKFEAFAQQVALELAGKLGTLNEQNNRSQEEKLNSELRAASEKNGRFQVEVGKLMSEVRVARERNVKLEDKIKSLVAREKKLKSELKAAVERNLKLKGEVKSLEAREEKLKSEVRAAVERNVKIKQAITSVAKQT